jgi:peptidyl-prolyl cis-trans isomerase C
MNRFALVTLSLLAAVAAFGQQAAPANDPSQEIVATVNGERITKAKLDALYDNMPAPTRAQYDQAGGKKVFLDNYVAKRLLVQEAMKKAFDQRPEIKLAMDAARESALFDRYVRDVVATSIVGDAEIRKYYDERPADFTTPEQVKVRHIVISWNGRTRDDARKIAEQVLSELMSYRIAGTNTEGGRQVFTSRFAEAARKYSEDGTAQQGGDLGWAGRGQFDPAFEQAAFGMKPGVMSGIIETQFGYHLILVEDKKLAGLEPFESVRNEIREYLLGQKTTEIMMEVKRLTNELRQSSKVSIYTENVD